MKHQQEGKQMTPNSIETSCKTDVGLKRHQNEDVCDANIDKNYFMVADGMGGAAKGDLASKFFLEAIDEVFSAVQPQTGPTLKERFYACFEDSEEEIESAEEKLLNGVKDKVYNCFATANDTIQAHIERVPQHAGMGCTGELLTLFKDRYVIGHVGDSRSYLLKPGNSLRQLTIDHSLVQEQLDRGGLQKQQLKGSNLKNVLTRAIGVKSNVEVDLISGIVTSGDIFLLCSDGLYNMVTDEEIEAVLLFDAPLSFKAEMLVNMANDNGGRDNISVTLLMVQ